MKDPYENRESVVLESHGQKIFGVFHQPFSDEPFPTVLICHGLAGHKIGTHRLYVSIAECLTKAGVGVFRFDYRGNGDSEGDFSDMTIDSDVEDGLVVMNFISQHPKIDINRLGIMGRSFGGALAVLTASHFGNFKSIALWSPVFNAYQWEEKWEMMEAGKLTQEKRHELMRINGQLPSMGFYEQLFSLDLKPHLENIAEIPMLHIHGEEDPIVSIEHAYFYERERKKLTTETKFIKLPHSDHDFSHPEEKELAIRETCKWFQRTL